MSELKKIDPKPFSDLFQFADKDEFIEQLEDIYHNYASLTILSEEPDQNAPNHLTTLRLITDAFKKTKAVAS